MKRYYMTYGAELKEREDGDFVLASDVAELEAELAEAVRLLETVRLVGRMDDWNKCAGLIAAFLARQEESYE